MPVGTSVPAGIAVPIREPATIPSSKDSVRIPSVNFASVMARMASASGSPVSWGTCTSSLPETTSTLTVEPLSTSVPAGGSWLTIVPSALSLFLTYVGSSTISSCWAVAEAFAKDWSTNDGSATVPGPGVVAGPSAVKRRKRPRPAMTRMTRPSTPAIQIHGLVRRGSSGSSSSRGSDEGGDVGGAVPAGAPA